MLNHQGTATRRWRMTRMQSASRLPANASSRSNLKANKTLAPSQSVLRQGAGGRQIQPARQAAGTATTSHCGPGFASAGDACGEDLGRGAKRKPASDSPPARNAIGCTGSDAGFSRCRLSRKLRCHRSDAGRLWFSVERGCAVPRRSAQTMATSARAEGRVSKYLRINC